jgi:hypothetical protein
MPSPGYPYPPESEQAAFEEAAFRAWLRRLDAELLALCGLERDDLPDYPYRDAFDAGDAPGEAAAAALEDVGFFPDGPGA